MGGIQLLDGSALELDPGSGAEPEAGCEVGWVDVIAASFWRSILGTRVLVAARSFGRKGCFDRLVQLGRCRRELFHLS